MRSQSDHPMGIERLQYLEFVIFWLEEHRCQLSTLSYQRLRQAARRQLAALHQRRLRLAEARLAAVQAVQREVVLVAAVRAALNAWVAAGALAAATANRLDRQLGRLSEDLRLELAGQPAGPRLSPLNLYDYALRSLPAWSRLAAIAPAERLGLAAFLCTQRRALVKRGGQF